MNLGGAGSTFASEVPGEWYAVDAVAEHRQYDVVAEQAQISMMVVLATSVQATARCEHWCIVLQCSGLAMSRLAQRHNCNMQQVIAELIDVW